MRRQWWMGVVHFMGGAILMGMWAETVLDAARTNAKEVVDQLHPQRVKLLLLVGRMVYLGTSL